MAARRRRRRPGDASPWPFVGMAGMASVLFLYGAGGLIAPWWAVVLLLGVWLVLFVQACRWWTPRPRLVPVLPVVAVLVWFAVMVSGGLWLGWGWSA
ncbi:hypothetical protein [Nocardioides sp. W7]|uniref:hypothetical protein n=1 Tax=Nocardioides sp. W7 TaxID=2931390 RepID=UPI001FD60AC2|nr:hypothetical protein [Nocardioides sp. W7]